MANSRSLEADWKSGRRQGRSSFPRLLSVSSYGGSAGDCSARLTTWAIANNVPLATTSRSRSRVAALRAQAPFKSDAQYDYFRKIRQISVTLAKPLGAVLEECPPAGVRVEELQDGGSAAETELLKKGDRIRSVQGVDAHRQTLTR